MVRFSEPPHDHVHQGGSSNASALRLPPSSRFNFNDMASYVTDTSSVTNPAELAAYSYSSEDDIDDATSALTGLTGWTSAYGAGGAGAPGASSVAGSRAMLEAHEEVSELGESTNFPMARDSTVHSIAQSAVTGNKSTMSKSKAESAISALSFDLNGSVETSLGEINIPRTSSHRSSQSNRSRMSNGGRQNHSRPQDGRNPLTAINPGAAPSRSRGNSYGGGVNGIPAINLTSSNLSNNSNSSKKQRAPVPPLRDPNMDDAEEDQMWEEDCNYDINPTLLFLVLESRDWNEAIALLDAKGIENKNNEAWNLGSLFGVGKKQTQQEREAELKNKRKAELKAMARTWIVRRERNGVLRWRMLPLHAALAFGAPFDVVLRLYHLYPGAVRCRNDQGMLPMHHVFKYGNDDRILELLLDVFPEALTVLDDKGRGPVACTPKDGSDNERRSHILTLFGNFRVLMAQKEFAAAAEEEGDDNNSVATEPPTPSVADTSQRKPPSQSSSDPASPPGGGTLGAAPRYAAANYDPVAYGSIKPIAVASPMSKSKPKPSKKKEASVATPLSPKEDDSASDRYAMFNVEDGENNPTLGNTRISSLGLSPIPEEQSDSLAAAALKSELMALGEKKRNKKFGLPKKLFGGGGSSRKSR